MPSDIGCSQKQCMLFWAILAFWEGLHCPTTQVERGEGDDFDDNLEGSVVIQAVAAVHFELFQLQLLEAFGDCDVSETERQIKTAHGLGMHLQQCVRKLILLAGSFTSSLQ